MKIIKLFLFFSVFAIFANCTTLKPGNGTGKKEHSEDSAENYIPSNLDEALTYLNSVWPEKDKEEYKNQPEDEAVTELHFSTGLAIRNNWGFWTDKGNSLTRYFNSLGIFHPDDMSSIILTSFHRQLNGKDIDLEGQIEKYIRFWNHTQENE